MQVTKSTGETRAFSKPKLIKSLLKAGADKDTAQLIVERIEPQLYEGIPTKTIYRKAFRLLKKYNNVTAAKYSLKSGLLALGPSGFPFEQYISRLFGEDGYQTSVNVRRKGNCVAHELDVVAKSEQELNYIECKFHNKAGIKSDVKDPLYIKARFDDLQYDKQHFRGWLITNTKFTDDAVKYATCVNLSLMSWQYPEGNGLKDRIDRLGLHPVTCLTSLRKKDKQFLLDHEIVTCRDLLNMSKFLQRMEITPRTAERTLKEAELLVYSKTD